MKKKYQHIKCLPCPNWATSKWTTREELLVCFTKSGVVQQIQPVFKRNGYYYDRKVNLTWIEINGEAFKYNTDYFLYELKIASHKQLSKNERKAIETLIHYNNCPRVLSEQYHTDNQILQFRDIEYDTRKYFISFKNEHPEAFKKE